MIIGLSRKKNAPLSKLISWWMGTSYSHTYIQLGDKIYHATSKGVHIVHTEEFVKNNEIIREYYFGDVDENLAKLICLTHLGKKYGYLTLVGIFLRDTLGINLLGKDDSRTFICSELVGTVLELTLDVELGDQNYFTPRDIEEKLEWINYKKTSQ